LNIDLEELISFVVDLGLKKNKFEIKKKYLEIKINLILKFVKERGNLFGNKNASQF
jgi:hypothetical protein